MSTKRLKSDTVLTILTVALLVIAVFSAVRIFIGTEEKVTFKISVIFVDPNDSKWESFVSGLEEASVSENVNLNIVTSGKIDSMERMEEVVTEEIQNGAKGIILEPCSNEGLEDFIKSFSKDVKIAIINSGIEDITSYENTLFVDSDNEKVGISLGEEILDGFLEEGDEVKKTIGVITGEPQLNSMDTRYEAFLQYAKDNGFEIVWSINSSASIKDVQTLSYASVIVALGDDALSLAESYASSNPNGNLQVYGYGCSQENLYHLNTGTIRSVVVPNGYSAAFTLIETMVSSINQKTTFTGRLLLETNIITQENMFHEIYQQMLFPTD